MQQALANNAAAPTLRQLVRGLGRRTTIITDALELLKQRGHTFSKSAVYATISRNGLNNAAIEAALLDAIQAERHRQAAGTARRQSLAA